MYTKRLLVKNSIQNLNYITSPSPFLHRFLIAGIGILFLFSFANAASSVNFAQDAEVENLATSEKKTLKKAEPLNFSNETPYLIRMPDKVPILLIPVDSSRSKIDIEGYPLSDLVAIRSQKEIDQILSGLIVEIGSIQNLTRKRQFDLALQKLNVLQTKYPRLASLNFLKASLFFLSGKKTDAQVVLQEALQEYPDNAEGKKLLEEIKRN